MIRLLVKADRVTTIRVYLPSPALVVPPGLQMLKVPLSHGIFQSLRAFYSQFI